MRGSSLTSPVVHCAIRSRTRYQQWTAVSRISAGSACTQAARRRSQTSQANIQSDTDLVRPIDRQERLSRNNTMIVAAQTRHLESFLHKAETKTLTTGIIGLGYVGLPLAHLFS